MIMQMQMYFNTKTDVYVLFEAWHVTTAAEMVIAFLGVFFLAIFSELLKVMREYTIYRLKKYFSNKRYYSTKEESALSEPLIKGDNKFDYATVNKNCKIELLKTTIFS
ncbi:copper transporter family protein, partial [Salmonella sp. s51228]|uniref:copper transporter family protein n=1 Tax=Salmonella sp. s51228 TaxID=3159652 RepID=UPI0039803AAC